MSERQALVEEALKLMQEYPPPEPVGESLSKRARALLTSRHPEQTLTAAESAKQARRAAAEFAKAENPSTSRHDRKCSVCRHRDRDEIEREFLNWRSPDSIAEDYGIAHHSSIYRHARATGLFAHRALAHHRAVHYRLGHRRQRDPRRRRFRSPQRSGRMDRAAQDLRPSPRRPRPARGSVS
jgi:hypothetical protein